jgi:hypothetical protein
MSAAATLAPQKVSDKTKENWTDGPRQSAFASATTYATNGGQSLAVATAGSTLL